MVAITGRSEARRESTSSLKRVEKHSILPISSIMTRFGSFSSRDISSRKRSNPSRSIPYFPNRTGLWISVWARIRFFPEQLTRRNPCLIPFSLISWVTKPAGRRSDKALASHTRIVVLPIPGLPVMRRFFANDMVMIMGSPPFLYELSLPCGSPDISLW
ncbi:MAG: hypothetical protein BWX92_03686 [Deltaproteobacteria bacterium ADurb.Bin135]|nr:MAG: hypothetical protein BWX92_03686 [Deltaproteobacteria bacterium ADurb.Bin135]